MSTIDRGKNEMKKNQTNFDDLISKKYFFFEDAQIDEKYSATNSALS